MKKGAVLILFLLTIIPLAFAWDDCVHGEADCTYPGNCGSYIDTDSNYVCDHSEEAPNEQEAVSESALINQPIKYHPIEIILIISLLYFLTWFLTKKKKISVANHRKAWNIALLVSFVLTAIFGIFMTTQIAIGWPNWQIRGLHVDPGVAMVTISIYHILWHIPYIKQMFKFIKKPKTESAPVVEEKSKSVSTSDKQASENYDQTESSK